ncbi:MAG: hypothetical protein RQ743_14645, partial [Bacteroidales bacterium]|nr:hypothetical protein [Bacteroidales bacterium]
ILFRTNSIKRWGRCDAYRSYNPALGRWINRDPFREDGGVNIYVAFFNTSELYYDYLGMASSSKNTSNNGAHGNSPANNLKNARARAAAEAAGIIPSPYNGGTVNTENFEDPSRNNISGETMSIVEGVTGHSRNDTPEPRGEHVPSSTYSKKFKIAHCLGGKKDGIETCPADIGDTRTGDWFQTQKRCCSESGAKGWFQTKRKQICKAPGKLGKLRGAWGRWNDISVEKRCTDRFGNVLK